MTLEQFRQIELSPTLQKSGELVGGAGSLLWFWWVLLEKDFLQIVLSEQAGMVEMLLGIPLLLILPAIYYTAVFILLRFLVWIF